MAPFRSATSEMPIVVEPCLKEKVLARARRAVAIVRRGVVAVVGTHFQPPHDARSAATRLVFQRSLLQVLDSWSVLMPQRIVNEDFGDFREDINRRIARGQSRRMIWLRVVAAVFWLTVNSVRYFLNELRSKRSIS
jgi:hypothetical protein